MITTQRVELTKEVISDHGNVSVMHDMNSGQHSLRSNAQFAVGDIICEFYAASIQPEASYLTVQIDDDKHITLLPDFLQYTNHSCDPNAFFDTTTMEFLCIKEIQPGDELTFFYPSTEWEMAQPFDCYCGAAECMGVITGAANMSMETLSKYRLTDFIRRKLASSLAHQNL
jgi:hypothetical protein